MAPSRFRYHCVCVAAFITAVHSAEVDQFSIPCCRVDELNDSATVLAHEVNRRIDQALTRANFFNPPSSQHGDKVPCDRIRLYDSLSRTIARPLISELEAFAENTPQIQRKYVAFEDSVYRDSPWMTAPSLRFHKRLASMIRLAGHIIGTDKIGHFFSEGYTYFMMTLENNGSIESAMRFGMWSETSYFGLQMTGVYSWADLTANFQGMRFWNSILAEYADPLDGERPSPLVECMHGRWQRIRAFSWEGYVDAGWNESINCAGIADKAVLAAIAARGFHCDTQRLPAARYGPWAAQLLNTRGFYLFTGSEDNDSIQ